MAVALAIRFLSSPRLSRDQSIIPLPPHVSYICYIEWKYHTLIDFAPGSPFCFVVSVVLLLPCLSCRDYRDLFLHMTAFLKFSFPLGITTTTKIMEKQDSFSLKQVFRFCFPILRSNVSCLSFSYWSRVLL